MSLFNQIGKIVPTPGSNPGAPAAQENTSPRQESSSYLTTLEQSKAAALQKLSELYLELGKAYYEGHSDDHQTEYEENLTAIRDAHTEITRCQQQSDEITARRRCPACGAELTEGSRFCNICGTKLPEVPGSAEEQNQGQRLCPQCKAVLGPDDVFCTSCGADLRK